MRMKVSDYIAQFLVKQNVPIVFGYIGGMITHLVDSLGKNPNIRFIQTYHEQTAAIAAEGYAIESGNIGVAISTSGPGATNMITGIADAFFDSIPVVYITGQVNSYEYKYNASVRQKGFQETNIVSMVRSVTKYAVLVDKEQMIRYELEKAFHYAKQGRPGPVLLDIPMNIQKEEIDIENLVSFISPPRMTTICDFNLKKILHLLKGAKYPMVLVGGGCHGERVKTELELFINRTNYPVVSSLKGKGAFGEDHPNYLGMIGAYGNRCANMAMAKVDLLLALGTRLDIRQTGTSPFIHKGKIIHVDIDENELFRDKLANKIPVFTDVCHFLYRLNNRCFFDEGGYEYWWNILHKLKQKYNQKEEVERFVENRSPYKFMEVLSKCSREDDVFCADVGQNQMWVAQTVLIRRKNKFITSGGLAPMGFSLPASIGVAFANPDVNIYSINGDGGFHIAMQSLMLISQYDLPIKVIVMNNRSLGMITQFQELYFDGNMIGTTRSGGYYTPSIGDISHAYGLNYYRLSCETMSILKDALKCRNCVIEYVIDGLTTVSPKLKYGDSIERMSPSLLEEEYDYIGI